MLNFADKSGRCSNIYIGLLMVGAVVALVGTAVAVDISGWGADECVKCHAFEVRMVGAGGGMHTELNCVDCHREHPPETEALTLGCVVCHDGQLHFTIGSCRGCHADPHRPLISLRDISRPARTECLSCHTRSEKKCNSLPTVMPSCFVPAVIRVTKRCRPVSIVIAPMTSIRLLMIVPGVIPRMPLGQLFSKATSMLCSVAVVIKSRQTL